MFAVVFDWLVHHVTLHRWYGLLFVVGVLLRWQRPATNGTPFPGWLRLRGRNILLTYSLRPFGFQMEAALMALLVPPLAPYGLLPHLPMPSWLQTVMGVLLLDLSFYFRHRLDHAVPVLWRIHRVHHSDPDVDVTTTAFSHPLAGPMRLLWQWLTIALLGIPTSATVLFLCTECYLSYFQHSPLRVELVDRLIRYCGVISPLDHRTHHSRDLPETDSNFGVLFNIWDRLLGTYRQNHASEIHCGLAEFDDPQWQTLYGLLISPFRTLVRPMPDTQAEIETPHAA